MLLFRSGIDGRTLLFTLILGCFVADMGEGLVFLRDEGIMSWSSLDSVDDVRIVSRSFYFLVVEFFIDQNSRSDADQIHDY